MSVWEQVKREHVGRLRNHALRLRNMAEMFKFAAPDALKLADQLDQRAAALERPITQQQFNDLTSRSLRHRRSTD